MKRSLNHLTLIAQQADGTAVPDELLKTAQAIWFETIYPAGLFSVAGFSIPHDARQALLLAGAHKIFIYNGVKLVWEGFVDTLLENEQGQGRGSGLGLLGPWGKHIERRGINKRWVDDRVEPGIWVFDETLAGGAKVAVDRNNRIRITANNAQWIGGEYAALVYTMPTGQTIKRVVMAYDFSEEGQASPAELFHQDDADAVGTFTSLDNAKDGDTSTTAAFTLTSDDILYLKQSNGIDRVNGLYFDLSAVNNNAATMTVQRFTGAPVDTTPVSVKHDNGGAFTTLTNTFDNNTGTSSTVTITKDDFLYIKGLEAQCVGFRFDFGATVNAVEANTRVQRYDAASSTWRSVTPESNGTEVKGTNDMKPFAQDGSILIDHNLVGDVVTIDGVAGRWFRLTFSADLTASIVINEIYVLSGWETLSITDNTALAGATLGQSGSVTWALGEAAMVETKINSINGLWFRVKVSATLDAVTAREVYIKDRQTWLFRLRDTVAGANVWNLSANGTGSQDVTLGTPRQSLELQLVYNGSTDRLPPSNGTIYGEISGIQIFSETGNINAYEIANDIRGALSSVLSANATLLSSASVYSLIPHFLTESFEYFGSIIQRAVAFGNSAGAGYGYGLRASQLASDGLPIMFLETVPSLADLSVYEYEVFLRGGAEVPTIKEDFEAVRNWIAVKYTDASGYSQVVTPDDDATLKDTASITTWGQQEEYLDAGGAGLTAAIAYGVRFLASRKDPPVSVSGPVVVVESIRHREGFTVPASEIQAGKRLKIVDYKQGLLALVTATHYEDVGKSCALTLGFPDDLAVLLARGL